MRNVLDRKDFNKHERKKALVFGVLQLAFQLCDEGIGFLMSFAYSAL